MRLRRPSLYRRALDTLNTQQEIIRAQRAQMDQMQLEYARNTRDLLENFWIAQESGMDVREPLLIGLKDMRDAVARLEEHIT